jgi:DNA repair ATPase RecN
MKIRLPLSFYNIRSEHAKTLKALTGILLNSTESMRKSQDDVLKSFGALSASLDECIHLQINDSKELLEQKSLCIDVFGKLNDAAESFNKMLTEKTQNLNKLKTIIEYCGNSETLLDDANNSFVEAHRSFSYEAYRQLQIVINKLNLCADNIQSIQKFPRPFVEMINLYTVKIEEVLKEINESKLMSFVKLLQVQAVQKGKKRKKFCNVCGTKIDPSVNFCPKCETSVSVGIP